MINNLDLSSHFPAARVQVGIFKLLTGDYRSKLGEKLKKALLRHGFIRMNTSYHEGWATQEQLEALIAELNEVIRSHQGPGSVVHVKAKIGNDPIWYVIAGPSSEASLAA